ncbi:hypothetical protein VHN57_12625 [Sphingobium sp. WW5]|mgnify:CR=1 FL=1|uniref:DarT1-associated NADAR antitoxin family protein n=1 Tax=unclassified Sphingobium TaxID=2611147 RepID=UPI003C141CC6
MAVRPVYLPNPGKDVPVRTEMVEFKWHPGLSVAQKQRSIASLHEVARLAVGGTSILEVSSKSMNPLGVRLSAFNLAFTSPFTGRPLSVECAFQGSKKFQQGGPYTDLLSVSAREAKRDPRLRASGNLTTFSFDGMDWPLEPQTLFYDWLYINALRENSDLAQAVMDYGAFTDIEFNPKESINCQAYSVALYVSLEKQGRLEKVTRSPEAFQEFANGTKVNNARQNDERQASLF